ncbi:MAG: hypothetical protein C5S45_09995 [Candidatus Methanocomedens sp.]|nr:MAG: hypothetical protein C5S45_09995 [ANME-2 cluster archaeon]
MTIYKGVLQHMAGGSEYGNALKFVRREFINIGDQHIREVHIRPYHDELLLSLVGNEITLSGIGGKKGFTVVGVKTPDGEVSKASLIGLIIETILTTIVSVVVGFMILIVSFIFMFIPFVGWLITLIGLAFFVKVITGPTIQFFQTKKVWKEL